MSKEREEALKLAEVLMQRKPRQQREIGAALLDARADGIESAVGGYACSCHEAYKSRSMVDPDCRYHDYKSDTDDAARFRAEAAALREKT